jgi:hypothetical protein
MAASTVPFRRIQRKLINNDIPDTEMSRLIREGYALAKFDPTILDLIDQDRDVYALLKKAERLQDREWLLAHGQTPLALDDVEIVPVNQLGSGRTRIPALLVLIAMLMRGRFGGFKDESMATLLGESRTWEICLAELGMTALPGQSTLIENTNAVSVKTRELILDVQARLALAESLDDFKKLTFDSTKVDGNSAWPTDSGLAYGFARRAQHIIGLLGERKLPVKVSSLLQIQIDMIRDAHKQIQLGAGKKGSARQRTKLYRRIRKAIRKALAILEPAYKSIEEKFQRLDVIPSERMQLAAMIESLEVDIKSLKTMSTNIHKRINRGEKVPTNEKIVSLADPDCAIIVKGEREPAIGYKPQIARSEQGFVVGLIVPIGNAADSGQMEPIADQAIARTGVTPSILSYDDGYTNGAGRDRYMKDGIEVSFSGSKGTKLIPREEYESDDYKKARNDRSAVESLMFTLKYNHDLDRVMRRGIEAVRAELLEKAIAYNSLRMIVVREKLRKKAIEAKALAA